MFSKQCGGLALRQLIRVNRSGIQRSLATVPDEVKPFQSIPGLSKLPIIGPFHHFLPVIGTIGPEKDMLVMTGKLHKLFGPIVRMEGILSFGDFVYLFEPEYFDRIYRAEDITAPVRPGFETSIYYKTVMRKDIYGKNVGLTGAQGADWREFRTKVNPSFLKVKMVKVYQPALKEIANDFVVRLAKIKDDISYMENNFNVELTKFSLESIGFVGLGTRLGCFQDNLAEDHPYRLLMKSAKDILDLSFKLEFLWTPWRYIPMTAFKNLVAAYDTQWRISEIYITEARKRINARGHDIPEDEKSIIEKLLAIDQKVAIMMANEMLMAGIDTVAHSLTAMLYMLAKNPEVQTKLRETIQSGDTNKRYLKACIKETLRLYPVVAANLRETSKDHVLEGYQIPKGVKVIAPNEYLSKQEKYYPRPLEFIPERWIAEKSDPLYYGNTHPMITMPFGFGVRSCIGRRIAELEIECFIEAIIKNFAVNWEGPPIKLENQIMNKFVTPFFFRFERV